MTREYSYLGILAVGSAACANRSNSRYETRKPVSVSPCYMPIELAVIEYYGIYALAFPCRRVLPGWINAETKGWIDDLRPTHWREWRGST